MKLRFPGRNRCYLFAVTSAAWVAANTARQESFRATPDSNLRVAMNPPFRLDIERLFNRKWTSVHGVGCRGWDGLSGIALLSMAAQSQDQACQRQENYFPKNAAMVYPPGDRVNIGRSADSALASSWVEVDGKAAIPAGLEPAFFHADPGRGAGFEATAGQFAVIASAPR